MKRKREDKISNEEVVTEENPIEEVPVTSEFIDEQEEEIIDSRDNSDEANEQPPIKLPRINIHVPNGQ